MRFSQRLIKSQLLKLICLLILSQFAAQAAPQAALPLSARHKVDLHHYIFSGFGYDSAIVCLLDKNTLLTARYGFDGNSAIDYWDAATGRVKARINPPEPVNSGSVVISPDGKQLMAFQDVATDHPNPVYNPHKIYLWDFPSRKLKKSVDLGSGIEVNGARFSPVGANRIIVSGHSLPNASDDPRLLMVNAADGHVDRVVGTPHGFLFSQDTFAYSPDHRLLIGMNIPDEGAPCGSFEVFDAKTLAGLAYFNGGTHGHHIDQPFFFISDHELAIGGILYDTRTAKVSPLLPGHKNLRCMAAVPGHRQYAIFSSIDKLELWNVAKPKLVQQWVLPRRVSRTPELGSEKGPVKTEIMPAMAVYVARDDKAFGILDDVGVVRIYDYDFNALPAD